MANEKRLIDGNGIYTLHASDNTDYSLLFRNGIICVENELGHCVCEFYADDAPTVDAVEVRCKDCNWWNENDQIFSSATKECRCGYWKGLFDYCKPDDFCSYGERKDK